MPGCAQHSQGVFPVFFFPTTPPLNKHYLHFQNFCYAAGRCPQVGTLNGKPLLLLLIWNITFKCYCFPNKDAQKACREGQRHRLKSAAACQRYYSFDATALPHNFLQEIFWNKPATCCAIGLSFRIWSKQAQSSLFSPTTAGRLSYILEPSVGLPSQKTGL